MSTIPRPGRLGIPETTTREREPWPVLHTRGAGMRQVAEILAGGPARRLRGDLHDAVFESRAVMLVARTVVDTDLLRQVVPHQVDLTRARSVVGAIGGGPHAGAVADVTARVGSVMSVPAELVAASPGPSLDEAARAALDTAGRREPGLDRSLVRVTSVDDLVRMVPTHALLVIGAPGGSWLQRQFLGPGRKMAVGAPSGALVVHDAPRRCLHAMEDWNAAGPAMRVADALRLMTDEAWPVVDAGRVIGIIRRSVLATADPTVAIAGVMEPPVAVAWDAPPAAAEADGRRLDGAPVPVTGPSGHLIGAVRPRARETG
ncbi:MAG TPA: hypothetical protein VLD62_03620 [Acidimicrobiia bacterium]|nr:hypothetical protein [Acidimicrobiia bacterium]